MKRYIITILFILSLSVSLRAERPLTLIEGNSNLELNEFMEYLRDPGAGFAYEDITQGPERSNFYMMKNKFPAFGFTKDALWLKFSVRDLSEKKRDWYLMFDYPLLDNIDIVISSGGNVIDSVSFSKENPSTSRFLFRHRKIIFPLYLDNNFKTYTIRVKTDETLEVPARIIDAEALGRMNYREMFLNGIYYGITGVMLLYNLFIFITLRDKSYMYYILYLASVILAQSGLDGYIFAFTASDLFDKSVRVILGSAGITFAILFTINYLNIKEKSPALYRFLRYYIIPVNVPIVLYAVFGFYVSMQMILILLMLSGFMFLFIAGRYAATDASARFYLLAWVFMLFGAILFGLKSANIFIPHVTPYALQFGSALEGTILSFALGYKIRRLQIEKDNVTDVFGKTVSPEIRDLYLQGQINTGGDEKEATILFTDIRQFSLLSEKYPPAKIVSMLNRHFELSAEIISAENGLVNKFIGDSVMALFNIPLKQENHCERALNAAVRIIESTKELNLQFEKEGLPGFQLGMGIHTGPILAGNIGSSQRMEYTAIGDTVNIASRLEQLTKAYRTPILTTEDVIQKLSNPKHFLIREIDRVRLKGKENHVHVYEIYNADDPKLREYKINTGEQFSRARDLYRERRFAEAAEIYDSLSSEAPGDHVTKLMARRCRKLIENPPGENWTGAVVMAFK